MTDLFAWEIEGILWLRHAVPDLVGSFEILTFMGNEMFYLLLLPLLYWCLERQFGARLTVGFLLSALSNAGLKALVQWPRPFDYDPQRILSLFAMPLVEARERYGAQGYGFPSGHTQNTVVVWGYILAHVIGGGRRVQASPGRSRKILLSQILRAVLEFLCALFILLIPLSRIYLAVHFPRDVLGGYAIGAALLSLYLWLVPSVERRLAAWPLSWHLCLIVGLSVALVVATRDEGIITAAGTLMGMGVGFVLERRLVGFETDGPWTQRVLRYLLGCLGMAMLYGGLKVAVAGLEPALLWRAIRYVVLGLWGSFGAPWLFVRLGLARRVGSQCAERV